MNLNSYVYVSDTRSLASLRCARTHCISTSLSKQTGYLARSLSQTVPCTTSSLHTPTSIKISVSMSRPHACVNSDHSIVRVCKSVCANALSCFYILVCLVETSERCRVRQALPALPSEGRTQQHDHRTRGGPRARAHPNKKLAAASVRARSSAVQTCS